MELRDSGRTISFFSRIIFQLPTIAFSTITMIAISRNLGPSGRGEVSQILLLAALTSSILCTPIFLTIMNLKVPSEIKSYVAISLFLFNWKNVALVAFLNTCLLLFNRSDNHVLNLSTIILMDLLIVFYFIAAQIRDLLLRFHRNKIYAVDFAVQLVISGSVLALLVLHALTVSIVIQIFVFSYGLFALFLLSVLNSRVSEFEFANLIRKKIITSIQSQIWKTNGSFSKLGVLFQLALSKDLLFGLLLLSKADFGLMSALASFWVVVRFLRPSAVIQAKLGHNDSNAVFDPTRSILAFIMRASSAIYLQAISIGLMGFLGYVMTPILMGSGFKPSLSMTIAGLASEILLMKCLYDLSTSASKFSQNVFSLLCLLQIIILGIFGILSISFSISMIWFSSCFMYLIWQIINIFRSEV